MKMALVTAAHHSAYTNGVTETSVEHGPTGADETYSPVRASVTRGPADSHATPITVVVVTAMKMIVTRQSTRALTVSPRMSPTLQSFHKSESRTTSMNFLLNVTWFSDSVMHACDTLSVSPRRVVSFLKTCHLDDRLDMSVETVLDSNR